MAAWQGLYHYGARTGGYWFLVRRSAAWKVMIQHVIVLSLKKTSNTNKIKTLKRTKMLRDTRDTSFTFFNDFPPILGSSSALSPL